MANIQKIDRATSETMSIRIDPDLKKQVALCAKMLGKSKNSCINRALREFVEDYQDLLEAKEIWKRVVDGKEKLYTEEEVRKELGLED